jgi:uroporphyrinogen-III synthase
VRSLQGKHVVLTRAESDAEGLRGRLEALGARVFVVPSIRIAPLPPGPAMEEAVRSLPDTAWVAFASRHGVAVFAGLLRHFGASLPGATRLAAIGPSTAAMLAEHLRPADLVASRSTGEGLVQSLREVARPDDGVVLLPAAREGRTVLQHELRAAGYRVTHLPIYETVTAGPDEGPVALPPQVDYVLFTSPSTVTGFLARVGMPSGAVAVSIGPTTSAALRARGLTVTREASQQTLDGLVEALTRSP